MLPAVLANYPPNSDLFRWLHHLVDAWNGTINYYTFCFTGPDMPRRDYTIPTSHRGQKKVLEMVRGAIRSHKRGLLVDLDKMETDLAEAVDLMKRRSHFSRLHIHEALPFIAFFVDLLESVDIYGLELTRSGEQAVALLKWAHEEEGYRTGNLHEVESLLRELNRMVGGRLINVDPERDIHAGDASSEWINFYPEVIPFCVTLHLDLYVQSALSKEERATPKTNTSDCGLGCQQVDPRTHSGRAEGQYPSPGVLATIPPTTDQSDEWSSDTCCNEDVT